MPLFIILQSLLPQHLLSRLGGRLANSKIRWFKNRLIQLALKHYQIDMQNAKIQNPFDYPSFNAFFTRELTKPAVTYFPAAPTWGAPAEGVLSQAGQTDEGMLIQAKGRSYSVESLLADHPWCVDFKQGSFATIYLAPHNYHRVHSPLAGKITEIAYIPGKLFSVNLLTASHIDALFARNERMIFYIDSPQGKLAFVMVGALLVAGMKTPFKSWTRKEMNHIQHYRPREPISIEVGTELGYFDFGSTVILVSAKKLQFTLETGSATSLGQAFASL